MTDHPLYDPADDAKTSWALNPWTPMLVQIDVKHLGKLAEAMREAAEAIDHDGAGVRAKEISHHER